jgi:hypothetical protein
MPIVVPPADTKEQNQLVSSTKIPTCLIITITLKRIGFP